MKTLVPFLASARAREIIGYVICVLAAIGIFYMVSIFVEDSVPKQPTMKKREVKKVEQAIANDTAEGRTAHREAREHATAGRALARKATALRHQNQKKHATPRPVIGPTKHDSAAYYQRLFAD